MTTLLNELAAAILGPKPTAPEPPPMTILTAADLTTDEMLADLEAYLCKRFKVQVTEKGDSAIMRGVAAVFGVAAMLGVNVPTSEEFLTRFATTLGPVAFLPSGMPRGKRRTLLLLHEIGHGAQFWEEPLFYPRAYVQSGEKRAAYEAQAERGRIEGAWLLYGELPTADHVHSFMQHGYAVDAPDVTLAQQLVDIAATAADSGVVSSPVGLAVRDWLRSKQEPGR